MQTVLINVCKVLYSYTAKILWRHCVLVYFKYVFESHRNCRWQKIWAVLASNCKHDGAPAVFLMLQLLGHFFPGQRAGGYRTWQALGFSSQVGWLGPRALRVEIDTWTFIKVTSLLVVSVWNIFGWPMVAGWFMYVHVIISFSDCCQRRHPGSSICMRRASCDSDLHASCAWEDPAVQSAICWKDRPDTQLNCGAIKPCQSV